ncbi:FMN-dependent NADH-azoreductase [Paraburkholderia bannensis]|uniref:FMN dependent NADH:quinone oxidoreductase n=1 Tax=Paraburkholderia bannensis TaxID=765414 RepID=A0A7W9U535_9BURK|nr:MULTISPECIES: NAD(P)H-dependent oxidoreductase [Paraburkholderia]MBB3262202.1 FMN-dependent NADH-azoreductase [Paraburkholderia sp. WP4_3_2]MBB6107167.1 FMN-dependent NADH-azoreductase [Paraburkholderia bannensis]
MTKLLYIKGSPRAERSVSIRLADEYLAAYKQKRPEVEVDEIDLWQADLPEFDGDSAAAKVSFFGEPEMNGKQLRVFDELKTIFDRFNTADEYLFAAPMWNFGLPYKLKQYIDLLSMPSTLFGFEPSKGYIGLLKNKRATAIHTAAIYMPGLPKSYGTDHTSPHLTDWLNFAGVDDVTTIWYYGSKMRNEADTRAAYQQAVDDVRRAALR